jgi:hypothetical protein
MASEKQNLEPGATPPGAERSCGMSIERMIRILAGALVLISLILAATVSYHWLLLAAFVGLNLIQSAFTGFCLAESILRRIFPSTS